MQRFILFRCNLHCWGVQIIVWVAVAVLSVLIVASRKHYSVDVLIAWYVVPLVFWTLHRRWTTKRNINDGVILGDAAYLGDIESAAELQVCCLHTPIRIIPLFLSSCLVQSVCAPYLFGADKASMSSYLPCCKESVGEH